MLTENDLRPADILLSTGDATVSAVIRAGTGSRFSHASIYVGGGEIIEAIDPGVVRQSLARAMSDDTLVCVYRRLRMSDAQAQQVIPWHAEKTVWIVISQVLLAGRRHYVDILQTFQLHGRDAQFLETLCIKGGGMAGTLQRLLQTLPLQRLQFPAAERFHGSVPKWVH